MRRQTEPSLATDDSLMLTLQRWTRRWKQCVITFIEIESSSHHNNGLKPFYLFPETDNVTSTPTSRNNGWLWGAKRLSRAFINTTVSSLCVQHHECFQRSAQLCIWFPGARPSRALKVNSMSLISMLYPTGIQCVRRLFIN